LEVDRRKKKEDPFHAGSSLSLRKIRDLWDQGWGKKEEVSVPGGEEGQNRIGVIRKNKIANQKRNSGGGGGKTCIQFSGNASNIGNGGSNSDISLLS